MLLIDATSKYKPQRKGGTCDLKLSYRLKFKAFKSVANGNYSFKVTLCWYGNADSTYRLAIITLTYIVQNYPPTFQMRIR